MNDAWPLREPIIGGRTTHLDQSKVFVDGVDAGSVVSRKPAKSVVPVFWRRRAHIHRVRETPNSAIGRSRERQGLVAVVHEGSIGTASMAKFGFAEVQQPTVLTQ